LKSGPGNEAKIEGFMGDSQLRRTIHDHFLVFAIFFSDFSIFVSTTFPLPQVKFSSVHRIAVLPPGVRPKQKTHVASEKK
jgi:hypothetical protein